MKFSIKDFFRQMLPNPQECDQFHRKLRIWSHLLKKSLMENLNICAVYCTFPISNLSCTPKLIQRHYKLSKVEINGVIRIIFFFFCKIILKHRLSLGGVASPYQGCRQRNNCLGGLYEGKGFFSKLVLVTRHREG